MLDVVEKQLELLPNFNSKVSLEKSDKEALIHSLAYKLSEVTSYALSLMRSNALAFHEPSFALRETPSLAELHSIQLSAAT